MKRLFLIDGSNHAFRVHFALPPMHDATGFPTRALYGFTTLLGKLLRTWQPDYVAVAFDHGATFRHALYPDYKGHRPDMPEDLRAQWPHLPALVEAFGLRVVRMDGFEADDVLGALAAKHGAEGLEVRMVTGDADYWQLVNEHVHVLDEMKDEEIGPEQVLAKLGLPPSKVVDVKALAGDSSDNIPGVPGVGEKTAVKYLQKYGDLDGVLANWKDIGGKRGDAVRDHADDARLSRTLATIRTDLDLGLSLDDLRPRGLDEEALRERFDRWGFGMMARKLLPERQAVTLDRHQVLETAADLRAVEHHLRSAGRVVFEPDLIGDTLHGVAFSWAPGEAAYLSARDPELRAAILGWLADPHLPKVAHDAKRLMRALGDDAIGGLVGDTLLLDYLLAAHEGDHSLEKLSNRHIAHTLVASGTGGLPFAPPVAESGKRMCERALVIGAVADKLDKLLDERVRRVYQDIELPLVPVLAAMERVGIAVDPQRLKDIQSDLDARLGDLERACHTHAGRTFNVNSRHDISEILFESGKYPITATKKLKDGKYSTDSGVLEKLTVGDDLPAAILAYRQIQKLKSTYVDKLPTYIAADGRIHSTFDQAVAATGRLSSREPNLQNIPIRTFEGRRIRESFVPAPGSVFLSADYSQIELRILAHLSGEPSLCASFAAGEDIHRRTASEVFEVPLDQVTNAQRSAAKAINFGLLYGMSAFRLSNELQIDRAQATRYMDGYFARLPQVAAWLENTRADAKKRGAVETMFGRRRVLPEIHAANHADRMSGEREAINTPVQGAAADIIKIAMLRVDQALRAAGSPARVLLQVHDELLVEVPEPHLDAVKPLIVEAMSGAADLRVPLAVNLSVGRTWGEAH